MKLLFWPKRQHFLDLFGEIGVWIWEGFGLVSCWFGDMGIWERDTMDMDKGCWCCLSRRDSR